MFLGKNEKHYPVAKQIKMLRSGLGNYCVGKNFMIIKQILYNLAKDLIAPFALILLFLQALRVRGLTLNRQYEGEKPRLVYGPIPIISIKTLSQAMLQNGYEAKTFVYEVYSIHKPDDYDYYLPDIFKTSFLRGRLKKVVIALWGPYRAFLWTLPRFDIFHYFFDGGFLARTPVRFLEVQLLHLAGKKVVVMPYGSDVAVPTLIRSLEFRQALMMKYPYLGSREKLTLNWIRYFTRRADFIVVCLFHSETLPTWNLLTTHYYPIDTEAWLPNGHDSGHNGKDGLVTIVHASNHRELKGTEFLISACRELEAEGYRIEAPSAGTGTQYRGSTHYERVRYYSGAIYSWLRPHCYGRDESREACVVESLR